MYQGQFQAHNGESQGQTPQEMFITAFRLEGFVLKTLREHRTRERVSIGEFMQNMKKEKALVWTDNVVQTIKERGRVRVNDEDAPLTFSADFVSELPPFANQDARTFAPPAEGYDETRVVAWSFGEPEQYARRFLLHIPLEGLDVTGWSAGEEAGAENNRLATSFLSEKLPLLNKEQQKEACQNHHLIWQTGLDSLLPPKAPRKRKAGA